MDSNKINQLVILMSEKIPSGHIQMIQKQLENVSDENMMSVQIAISQMKSPMIAFLLTFFVFGGRAYIGEIWKTVVWWVIFLTLSWLIVPLIPLAIWAIIDDFTIYKDTQIKNVEIFTRTLSMLK